MDLGQTIIYSNNTEKLSSFLSHVFDLRADRKKNGISIRLNNIELFITKSTKANKPSKNFQTELEFFLDTEEELLLLREKIEFSWFKITQEEIRLQVEGDGNHPVFFRIFDFDGRPWKFSRKDLIQ